MSFHKSYVPSKQGEAGSTHSMHQQLPVMVCWSAVQDHYYATVVQKIADKKANGVENQCQGMPQCLSSTCLRP